MDETDLELLQRYAEENNEAAFEMLVRRYVNLVYSAALRSVESTHAAEEITQAVFLILARKASTLRRGTILSGWLYQTARLTAANYRRSEFRRAQREKEVQMDSFSEEQEPDPWPQIAPLLDEAMGRLNDKDRNAMVLRFFERKTLSEVGQAFGISEDAAKMRVNRAVEKLRRYFVQRGVTLSAALLAASLSAHSVQAAPAALAVSPALAAASASTVGLSGLVKSTLKIMAWTKTKMAVAAGAVLLLGGGVTTLVALKWEAFKQYHRQSALGAESWRNPNNDFAAVELAAAQVKILPTKFPNIPENIKANPSGLKWVGIAVPVKTIAWIAYNCPPARVVFTREPTDELYDFIANLPDGALKALQKELGQTLGYSGHFVLQETDVLLLKIAKANVRGLRTGTGAGPQNWVMQGRYFCDDVPLASTNRALMGLGNFLERVFAKPVIDQTGLNGNFNIDLRWDARQPDQPEAIKGALLEKLGFEVVPARQSLEMLVMEEK